MNTTSESRELWLRGHQFRQGSLSARSPHGWSWVWSPNLHQCLWTCLQVCGLKRLDCHADLYSQQVSHQRWIWGSHMRENMQRDPPWLWNSGQTSPEVHNRGISGPRKRTCVLQKFFKKSLSFRSMWVTDVIAQVVTVQNE